MYGCVEAVKAWSDEKIREYRKPMTRAEIELHKRQYPAPEESDMQEMICEEWPEPVTVNVYSNGHERGSPPMCRFKDIVATENDGEFLRFFKGKGEPASSTVPVSQIAFWCVLESDQ